MVTGDLSNKNDKSRKSRAISYMFNIMQCKKKITLGINHNVTYCG